MSAPSPAQRRVLDTAGIRRIGTDARNRPVVQGLVGIPNQLRTWAVKRDGDPVTPAEPVAIEVAHAIEGPDVMWGAGKARGHNVGCSCGWRAGTFGGEARARQLAQAHLEAQAEAASG